MDFVPPNRFVRPVALAHRFQVSDIVEKNRMAVHAGFGWGNSRERRGFHAGMAIPAIDPVVADMVLVAELNRLIPRYALIRDVRRSRNNQYRRQSNSR